MSGTKLQYNLAINEYISIKCLTNTFCLVIKMFGTSNKCTVASNYFSRTEIFLLVKYWTAFEGKDSKYLFSKSITDTHICEQL